MRDPADAAGHREQGELAAGRQAQRVHEHRERVVDIDDSPVASAIRSGTSRVNFRGAPARVSAFSSDCARGSPRL